MMWTEYDSDTHSHSHSHSMHRTEYVCMNFISFYSSMNGTRFQLVEFVCVFATDAHCHTHSVWLSLSFSCAFCFGCPHLFQVLLYWSFIAIINGHNIYCKRYFHLRILNLYIFNIDFMMHNAVSMSFFLQLFFLLFFLSFSFSPSLCMLVCVCFSIFVNGKILQFYCSKYTALSCMHRLTQ